MFSPHAELRHQIKLRGYRNKMFGKFCFAGIAEEPCACRTCIRHRFRRAEGFGGDDEKSRRRVYARQQGIEVVAIDVRDEMHDESGMAKRTQSLASHFRTEVGPAYADVDDVGNFFATIVAASFA